MKKHLNQRGFAAFEILILVLLVSVLGFVGYRAYTSRQAKPAETAQTKTTETPHFSEWKTYKSAFEGISFKYPGNWTIKTETGDSAFGDGSKYEQTILTSPSGLRLAYLDHVDGLGGGCNDDVPKVQLKEVERLADNHPTDDLFFVETNARIAVAGLDSEGKAQKAGYTGSCLFYPTIKSKHGDKGGAVMFLESPSINGGDGTTVQITSGDTRPASQLEDVEVARQILKSFKYE